MTGESPESIFFNSKGKAVLPNERFSSAEELRTCTLQLIEADKKHRSWERARTDWVLDGNQPINQARLDKKGLAWFPNANYRGMEGHIQALQTPLYDLCVEVDHTIEVTLDLPANKYTKEQTQDFENSIQTHYTWLQLTRWRKGFNLHVPKQQRNMLVHGMGAHIWLNERWTPRTPAPGQLLFPDNCSLDIENDASYGLLQEWVNGEDGYGFIRNEKEAFNLGWNPKAVWKSLANATKNNSSYQGSRKLEEIQAKMRSGDVGFSQANQVGFWMNWVFVREYEGGWSLYAIDQNYGSDYLFKKRFKFDELPIVLFPFDIGDGKTIHSIKGMGVRTRIFFELANRLNNAMAAQVFISAFPFVKQVQRDIDPDKASLVRLGALSRLPYGLDLQPISFPNLNQSGLALSTHLNDSLTSNGRSMSGAVPEPKDRETKYSFMLRSQDSARVSNGLQSLYESNLQQFQDMSFRRMLDRSKGKQPDQIMAEEFRERCRKDGVPEEALKSVNIAQVKEITSAGAGSAAARLQGIMSLMESPVYLNAPEDKKILMERDLVAFTSGGNRVNRYARSTDDANIPPSNEDSFITTENNGLVQGGDHTLGSGQNDVKHAQGHLQKAAEIIQMVQQGMPANQAAGALQALLDAAGSHISRLQQNPSRKAEFKQLDEQWTELAKQAKKIEAQAKSQSADNEQAEEAPVDFLNRISYKDSPDSVKMQIEKNAGVPRQPGDVSVPAKTAADKTATLQLKAQKQGVDTAFKAAQLSQKNNGQNGSKKPSVSKA